MCVSKIKDQSNMKFKMKFLNHIGGVSDTHIWHLRGVDVTLAYPYYPVRRFCTVLSNTVNTKFEFEFQFQLDCLFNLKFSETSGSGCTQYTVVILYV
jgi:hypothetical protein